MSCFEIQDFWNGPRVMGFLEWPMDFQEWPKKTNHQGREGSCKASSLTDLTVTFYENLNGSVSISHEFNQPTKPPSVHFGQHNEGQFVVQLLNPWLQIESPMDSPGISIENPSTITYLLRLSFFWGEIQSPRWILLFKKKSCFSNPSISCINSVLLISNFPATCSPTGIILIFICALLVQLWNFPP